MKVALGELVRAPAIALSDALAALSAGPGADAVHRARVAARRLRSTLRLVQRDLDPDLATAVRAALQRLGAALGAVRDLDVLIARLDAQAVAVSVRGEGGAGALRAHFVAERERRAATLPREVARPELHDALVALTHPGAALFAQTAQARSGDVRERVERSWRRLAREVSALPHDADEHALHRVRILAKRCRYASEAAAPALGKRGKDVNRLARALARLQAELGTLHDADVELHLLHSLPFDNPAIAELTQTTRAERDDLAAHWRGTWKRAKRRSRALR